MARTGRRRGSPDTREVILRAARTAFADGGYDGASIRTIATSAGVDPALVHHYFGTKEQLFLATVAVPIDPRAILPAVVAGGPDGIGERLLRTFLSIWDNPTTGRAAAALIRTSMQHDWSVRLIREFLVIHLLRPVMRDLDIDPGERDTRASLLASQLGGLIIARYIIKLEPLAGASPDAVVANVAPTIQRYLTEPLPSLLVPPPV